MMLEAMSDWGHAITGVLGGGVLVQIINSWIASRQNDRTFFSERYRQLLDDERGQVKELRLSIEQVLTHVESLKEDKIKLLEENIRLKTRVGKDE